MSIDVLDEGNADAFHFTGWEAETDLGNDDDRENVYFITIWGPDDEEVAVIIHRTYVNKYPLDGEIARSKEQNAQMIVDALNTEYHRLGG